MVLMCCVCTVAIFISSITLLGPRAAVVLATADETDAASALVASTIDVRPTLAYPYCVTRIDKPGPTVVLETVSYVAIAVGWRIHAGSIRVSR